MFSAPSPPRKQSRYPSHPTLVSSSLPHETAFAVKRSRGDIQTVRRHREPLGHLLMAFGPKRARLQQPSHSLPLGHQPLQEHASVYIVLEFANVGLVRFSFGCVFVVHFCVRLWWTL